MKFTPQHHAAVLYFFVTQCLDSLHVANEDYIPLSFTLQTSTNGNLSFSVETLRDKAVGPESFTVSISYFLLEEVTIAGNMDILIIIGKGAKWIVVHTYIRTGLAA